jgi:hypothetical protein
VKTLPDALPEEFVYPSSIRPARVRSARRLDKRLLAVLLATCVVAVAFVGVRSLTAAKTAAPAARTTTSTARVPMWLVDSGLSADSATQTYRASVSIRNPAHRAAADVRVDVTLFDRSGRVLKTDTRSIEILPAGQTDVLDFSGEFSPVSGVPVVLAAKATARA